MTEAQYTIFLTVGTFVCSLGALLNLLRIRSRGNSALLMAAAFVTFGAILWMLKQHAPQGYISIGGLLLAAFLIADIVLRSRNREHPR